MRILIVICTLALVGCSGRDNAANNSDPDSPTNNVMSAQDAGTERDGASPDSGAPTDVDLPDVDAIADSSPTPDADDACIDTDADGYFVGCRDFAGIPGPDCDDSDPDNWESCASCVDADGDGSATGCDGYSMLAGPDCDDGDANVWDSCDTCIDADGDGWVGVCDAYDGLQGPDCGDDDANNWISCTTCVDGDGDGYYVGCDVLPQPDCNDGDGNVNPGAQEVMGNGLDDDCDPGSVDTCTYAPVPAQDPEPGILAGITAEHNYWRWRVGVPPLQWNATLANSAAAYVSTCVWGHDPNRSPDAGFSYVGENLYASGGMPSNAMMLNSVNSWASERADYDYGDVIVNGGPTVGHYTQQVWSTSTDVGCGFAYCPNPTGLPFSGTIVACRYGPGGNYLGQAPYGFTAAACVDLDNDDVFQSADPDDTDRSTP